MAAPTCSALRRVTAWNHLRAVALLPMMNVIVIPATILFWVGLSAANGTARSSLAGLATAAIGVPILLGGLALVAASVTTFVRRGNGTLAPWDPTRTLITGGLYEYSRNPMKAGLFLILTAECLLFGSRALIVWAGLFMIANVVYIHLSEEPGLRARFGAAYDDYCARVPRWLPSLSRLRRSPAGNGLRR
jgi:protein-S-isoprenylcysteine O-methyltransferase Ste14